MRLSALVIQFAFLDEFLELIELVPVVSLEHVESAGPNVGVINGIGKFRRVLGGIWAMLSFHRRVLIIGAAEHCLLHLQRLSLLTLR